MRFEIAPTAATFFGWQAPVGRCCRHCRHHVAVIDHPQFLLAAPPAWRGLKNSAAAPLPMGKFQREARLRAVAGMLTGLIVH